MSELEIRRLASIIRHKIADSLPKLTTNKEKAFFYNLLIEYLHHELYTLVLLDDIQEERNKK